MILFFTMLAVAMALTLSVRPPVGYSMTQTSSETMRTASTSSTWKSISETFGGPKKQSTTRSTPTMRISKSISSKLPGTTSHPLPSISSTYKRSSHSTTSSTSATQGTNTAISNNLLPVSRTSSSPSTWRGGQYGTFSSMNHSDSVRNTILPSKVPMPSSYPTKRAENRSRSDASVTRITQASSTISVDVESMSSALQMSAFGIIPAVTNLPFANITITNSNDTDHIGDAAQPTSDDILRTYNTTRPDLPWLRYDLCDKIQPFMNQTSSDWAKYDTDSWLEAWIDEHRADIRHAGFAAAFGEWATGNPDLKCSSDQSWSSCNLQPCNIKSFNVKDSELRQVYYVLESIRRMHSYFSGLREVFSVAGIASALAKSGMVNGFYRDCDKPNLVVMREVITASNVILGVIACGLGFGGANIANGGGAVTGIFSGGLNAIGPAFSEHIDQAYPTEGSLGIFMSELWMKSMLRISSVSTKLLGGYEVAPDKDIRTYFHGGSFVALPSLDKVQTLNLMHQFLTAQAINALWRAQRIFIIGGAACGDNQGIGNGPPDRVICLNGKAWYLMWWEKYNRGPLSLGPNNWIEAPPGSEQLGQGLFWNITLKDVIDSSVKSFLATGNKYDADARQQRMIAILGNSTQNPALQGPSLEGVFTIPVCDIGGMVGKSGVSQSQYILQPFGHDRRPQWCDEAQCSGDEDVTSDFLAAANLNNGFKYYKTWCERSGFKPPERNWGLSGPRS